MPAFSAIKKPWIWKKKKTLYHSQTFQALFLQIKSCRQKYRHPVILHHWLKNEKRASVHLQCCKSEGSKTVTVEERQVETEEHVVYINPSSSTEYHWNTFLLKKMNSVTSCGRVFKNCSNCTSCLFPLSVNENDINFFWNRSVGSGACEWVFLDAIVFGWLLPFAARPLFSIQRTVNAYELPVTSASNSHSPVAKAKPPEIRRN